jgi:hypothetical protein
MSKPVSYKRYRFLPEIVANAVWLYIRFPLSLRLIEEMLLERGIVVPYEIVRRWAIRVRCLIPGFDGAILSPRRRDALWAKFSRHLASDGAGSAQPAFTWRFRLYAGIKRIIMPGVL